METDSCRPICLIDIEAKLLEIVLHIIILLSIYGIRKGRSTMMAINKAMRGI